VLDYLTSGGAAGRRKNRPVGYSDAKNREIGQGKGAALSIEDAAGAKEGLKKPFLLVIESEGVVFDSIEPAFRQGYIPAFAALFSWGLDPGLCARLFTHLSLASRLKAAPPLVVLLAALKYLNRHFPSIRRAAVIQCLEGLISSTDFPDEDSILPALYGAQEDSPKRAILEWLEESRSLLAEASLPRCFVHARRFLEALPEEFPGAEVLVHATIPESVALNRWEIEGMGSCFLRLAGPERGDFPAYLRTALSQGYDDKPLLVVGGSYGSWQAAQAVGARFYPIISGGEEKAWRDLRERFLPAFLQGKSSYLRNDSSRFVSLLFDELALSELVEPYLPR
jgi:hypothetical protein